MKNIIDIFAYLVVTGIAKLVSILPKSIGYKICESIIFLTFYLISHSKSVAIKNIKLCLPEIKDPEKLYYDSLKVIAENLYTFCLIPSMDQDFIDKNIDCSEFIEVTKKYAGESKGVLATTAHFGMFELSAHLCSVLGFPLKILARDLKLPRIDNWVNSVRELKDNEVYSRKGAYRKTIRYLRNGHNVGILCDQNVKRQYATFVDLFGITASATVTIGHAVAKADCPLMFTVMARKKDGKYRFIAREIDTNFDKTDINEFTKLVMKNYHSVLEDLIREYPDHWFWMHRRFKTRPEGQKEDFYG